MSEAVGKLMQIMQAGILMPVLIVAEKTGLLAAMRNAGPLTTDQIAAKSGLQERYIREIVSALAAAGIVEYDPSANTFLLPDVLAQALVDESSPSYVGGILTVAPTIYKVLPKLIDSVHHGSGVPFTDYGPEFVCGIGKMTAPAFKNFLISSWIPAIPGLEETLKKGARVADIGCGSGMAGILMAKSFPNSQFFGFDVDQESIDKAKEKGAAEGMKNLSFECRNAVDFPYSPGFDVIFTFNVVHDLSKPVEVLTMIYEALKDDGLYVMMDPKAGNSLEENLRNPMAGFVFSMSTACCMTTCLSEGGPGYGSLMSPKIAESLCQQAGFKSFQEATLPNSKSAFYLVRKTA